MLKIDQLATNSGLSLNYIARGTPENDDDFNCEILRLRAVISDTPPKFHTQLAKNFIFDRISDFISSRQAEKSRFAFQDGHSENSELIEKLSFSASAGQGTLAFDDGSEKISIPKNILSRIHVKPENARFLTVSGTSMEPTLLDGDLVLVDISRQILEDNRIFVFTVGDDVFVKRFRLVPGYGWEIISDNPSIPSYSMPKGEHTRILGRVKWTERAL